MTQDQSPTLRLSVVLATYNRADTMRTTLDRLINQDIDHSIYEIIVVDDGSPDHTAEVVAEAQARVPGLIDYMRHENEGPGFTINRGIKAAKGELLLIMADDILFHPGALRAHLEMHERHPEPNVAVLGKVIQSEDLNQSAFLRKWDPFRFNDRDHLSELPYWMFWAANITVNREFMLEYGMFRDQRGRAGAPAHEDVEVGYRLSSHGLRVLYCREALGEHYHFHTLEQAIRRYYERGLNWGEFFEHAPDPKLLVANHVLTRNTVADYSRGLKDGSDFTGMNRFLSWHLFRKALLNVAFNRVTEPLFWRPLLAVAEKSAVVEGLMNRHIYRMYLYYHFGRGVRDGEQQYGT